MSVPEVSYRVLLTPSVSCSGMKMVMKLSFGTSSSCTSVRVVTVAVRVDLLRMARSPNACPEDSTARV